MFNIYYNGGGQGYNSTNLSLDFVVEFARAVLALGGEVTSIINTDEDN